MNVRREAYRWIESTNKKKNKKREEKQIKEKDIQR